MVVDRIGCGREEQLPFYRVVAEPVAVDEIVAQYKFRRHVPDHVKLVHGGAPQYRNRDRKTTFDVEWSAIHSGKFGHVPRDPSRSEINRDVTKVGLLHEGDRRAGVIEGGERRSPRELDSSRWPLGSPRRWGKDP